MLDATIHMPKETIVDDDVVKVKLYQPSFQGFIVDDVIYVPDVPTFPVAKSKFANVLRFDPPNICA